MFRASPALALAGTLGLLSACSNSRLKPAEGEEGELIESEGLAPHDPADPLAGKRAALADAQKKAVERVVGVYISAKTRVSKAVLVDQNILAAASGYVRKYDVVDEKIEDGFVKTRIKALVLYRKVGEDLKKNGLLRPPPPPGNPAVAIRPASGRVLGEDFEGASSGVRAAFSEAGFRVVSPEAQGSEIVVSIQASSRDITDSRLGGFRSSRARVELEALKGPNSQLLASRTEEASGFDAVSEAARAKALSSAGRMAAEKLSEEMSRLLSTRIEIMLRIRGLSGVEDAGRVAESLRLQPDILAASLFHYGGGAAEILATSEEMTGAELAAALPELLGNAFSVEAVSPYAVEIRKK